MMRRGTVIALLATALLGSTSALTAQERFRSKLWLELGGGPGVGRISCSNCDRVISAAGTSSNFRIGGVLSEKVLVALDNFTFVNRGFSLDEEEGKVVAETSTAALSVLWYPGRSGFYAKGGVGVAYGNFTVDAIDSEPLVASGVGLGLTSGIGYDYVLSRRLLITFNAGALVAAIGDITLRTGRVDDVIASLYQFTVGLTVR